MAFTENKQNLKENMRKYIILMTTVILVWSASFLGLFNNPDNIFYNLLFKLSRWNIDQKTHVILISIDNEHPLTQQTMEEFLYKIEGYKPRQVIFLSMEHVMSDHFLENASLFKNVTMGFTLPHRRHSKDSIKILTEQLKSINEKYPNINTGLSSFPPSKSGVYKYQYNFIEINGHLIPSVERAAVLDIVSSDTINKHHKELTFLVDFIGLDRKLPHISFSRIMNDNVLSSMIANKYVVIGKSYNSDQPGIFTPVSSENNLMSSTEYHGQAINTLVSHRVIHSCTPITVLFILLLITLLSTLSFYRLDTSLSYWALLLFIIIFSLISLYFLGHLTVWLPYSEMLISLFLLYILILRQKNISLSKGFAELFLNINARLRKRYYPASIYEIDEHWQKIVIMVTQTLNLNRLIFLEKIDGDHRLKEIQSYNCSLEDIDERRRDFLRTPYSTAIFEKGPIIIDQKKTYFVDPDPQEIQYLVPLTVAGDVLGFWAFGVKKNDICLISDFEAVVSNFSTIIGELVYNRQEFMPSKSLKNQFFNFFVKEKSMEEQKHLARTVYLLEKQLSSINEIFNGLSVYTVVYDLFGRILTINRNMLNFLISKDIKPFSISLLDLYILLSEQSVSDGQNALRRLVTEGKPFAQMISFKGQDYMLNLKPVIQNDTGVLTNDPAPFGVSGIILELTDQSPLIELNTIKEDVVERFIAELKNDLGVVQLSANMLKSDKLDMTIKENIYDMMTERIDKSKGNLDSYQEFIEKNSDVYSHESLFPINPIRILKKSIEELKIDVKKLGIEFNIHKTFVSSSIMGSVLSLKKIYKSILTLLLEDARKNTTLEISFSDLADIVEISFKNEGFGMPEEQLNSHLNTENTHVSRTFIKIKQAISIVEKWNGKLIISSDQGKGIKVMLSLNKQTENRRLQNEPEQ